eukprot:TRINITY_DN54861_c0_g1_i1.p1 TRINITY_DN54861_c0_g1~~TRINITY_DN54861_c0_g1_i1.p1  ORF type:complete len:150 (+),score=37.02 TRINITY_DN54861_c0_g1_i1:48-497(+)
MASLKEVYTAACARHKCKPNSGLLTLLDAADQTTLNYANNYCGSENGFTCLLEVIKANPQLQTIDLSGNFLSSENVRALVDVLIPHPSIRRVKLNNNRLYIDAGKDLIRLARQNRRIVEVEVDNQTEKNNNKIPPKLMEQLARELQLNR